jgi:hypothetical protein
VRADLYGKKLEGMRTGGEALAAPYGGYGRHTQFKDASYEQVAGYADLQDSAFWTGTVPRGRRRFAML